MLGGDDGPLSERCPGCESLDSMQRQIAVVAAYAHRRGLPCVPHSKQLAGVSVFRRDPPLLGRAVRMDQDQRVDVSLIQPSQGEITATKGRQDTKQRQVTTGLRAQAQTAETDRQGSSHQASRVQPRERREGWMRIAGLRLSKKRIRQLFCQEDRAAPSCGDRVLVCLQPERSHFLQCRGVHRFTSEGRESSWYRLRTVNKFTNLSDQGSNRAFKGEAAQEGSNCFKMGYGAQS